MFKERIIASTLIAALVLPSAAFGATSSDFKDFPDDWSSVALENALDNGLIAGNPNGEINAQGTLTRAQMAAIMSRAFGAAAAASLDHYTDVDSDAWYYEELARAVQMGALAGRDEDTMNPNAPITRQEAFVVLARLFSHSQENTENLSSFKDGDEVADWAKEALAALVEAGYVNGSDQKLNPTGYITRAEFAQVMDNMHITYVDADTELPDIIEGNVIIREPNPNLKNKVIKGDLIIADNVSATELEGVKIEKRIILRGGSDNVKLQNVTAKEVIVENQNTAANLHVEDSDVGPINVKSDVNLKGEVKDVIVDKDNINIGGDAKLDQVQANGSNINVNIKDANVVAGESSSNINAGTKPVAPGESEVVETPMPTPEEKPEEQPTPTPGGGGSVTPTPAPGGGGEQPAPTPGETEEPSAPVEAQLVEQAEIMDLGWSKFVVVQFAEGNTIDNCDLAVDGVTVDAATTKVSDDGSIVKWEMTALDHGKLVVSKGDEQQTLTLGSKTNAPTVLTEQQYPDYFLMNGPVYVWDYHLTNYDNTGKARVNESKTTIDVNAQAQEGIKYYSPDAIIEPDESAHHGVKGEVQLMFNYAQGTDAEQAFVDGITDVDLVSYNENKNTLNDKLEYTLDKAFAHGDHTVACVKVPIGQENFYNNGRYYLRVTSNGKAELFPIHLVNKTVPSLQITSDAVKANEDVRFNVKDMTYGITMPIYRVDLTKPDGTTETLDKIDDWYLIGDQFTLYAKDKDFLKESGSYTLTIYADGFQTFSKTFNVTGDTKEKQVQSAMQRVAQAFTSIDALSSATTGGGSSEGGSEGGGGSNVMNANLVINSDLLINAKAIEALNIENAAATGISERWDSMTKLYAYNEGADKVYTTAGYFDAVNTAEAQGEYLTFADYIQSDKAETTKNRPAAVKRVMEDNLLGQATSFSESSAKAAPDMTIESSTEKSVVLKCTDKAYLQKLQEKGTVSLNVGLGGVTSKDKYEIKPDAGTITLNKVKIGENTLSIAVEGYQTIKLNFNVEKTLDEVTLTAEAITKGDAVVIKDTKAQAGTSDFFKYIQSIKIVAPDQAERIVRPEGSEMVGGEIGYTVNGDTLTIGKNIFNETFAKGEEGKFKAGDYKIVITAEYYGEQEVTVNVQAAEEGTPAPEKTADPLAVSKMEKAFGNENIVLTFADGEKIMKDAYVKAITKVTVNGREAKFSTLDTDGKLTIKANDAYSHDSVDFEAENTVVIEATGFNNATITIYIDDKGNPSSKPIMKKTVPEYTVTTQPESDMASAKRIISFPSDADKAYIKAVKTVTVNGKEVDAFAQPINTTAGQIEIKEDLLNQESNTVVIKASNYEDLTISIKKAEAQPSEPEVQAPAAPVFQTKNEQPFEKTLNVKFNDVSQGVDIYYTTDGKAPVVGQNGTQKYDTNKGVVLNKTTTIKAIAVKGNVSSEVAEATFTKKEVAPQPEAGKDAPTINKIEHISGMFDQKYKLIFNDTSENEDYVAKITEITMNNEKLKKTQSSPKGYYPADSNESDYISKNDCLVFTSDCFTGEKTIVIKAKGYKDLSFSVKDGILLLEEEEKAPAAPIFETDAKNEFDANLTVEFVAPADGVEIWYTTGEVNPTLQDKGTKYTNDGIKITDTTKINAVAFNDGKISGVTSATFTKKAEETKPIGKLTPKVTNIEYVPGAMFDDPIYHLSFNGSETDNGAYLEAISKITVNGTELTKKSTFWNDKMSYKFSNNPSFGGADQFIDFTEDCFKNKGEVTVKITATGYQDLTFKVNNGALVPQD